MLQSAPRRPRSCAPARRPGRSSARVQVEDQALAQRAREAKRLMTTVAKCQERSPADEAGGRPHDCAQRSTRPARRHWSITAQALGGDQPLSRCWPPAPVTPRRPCPNEPALLACWRKRVCRVLLRARAEHCAARHASPYGRQRSRLDSSRCDLERLGPAACGPAGSFHGAPDDVDHQARASKISRARGKGWPRFLGPE